MGYAQQYSIFLINLGDSCKKFIKGKKESGAEGRELRRPRGVHPLAVTAGFQWQEDHVADLLVMVKLAPKGPGRSAVQARRAYAHQPWTA